MTAKHYRLIGWALIILFALKDLILVFLDFTRHPVTVIGEGRIHKEIYFEGMFWQMFWNVTFDIFIWIGALLVWKADQIDCKVDRVDKKALPNKKLSIGKLLIILLSLLALVGVLMFILCIFIMSKTG